MFFPLGDQGGGMGGAQDINDFAGHAPVERSLRKT